VRSRQLTPPDPGTVKVFERDERAALFYDHAFRLARLHRDKFWRRRTRRGCHTFGGRCRGGQQGSGTCRSFCHYRPNPATTDLAGGLRDLSSLALTFYHQGREKFMPTDLTQLSDEAQSLARV